MTTVPQHFDDAFPSRPHAVRRSRASIFRRFSFWLLLAMMVGSWIAIYDGLTREFMTEAEELAGITPLTYEANKAAWVFATAVLPLILLHGRKLDFSFSESVLLWFTLGTATYAKDFAYMKIPGVPIFVTDVVLGILLISSFLWPRLRIPKLRSGLTLSLAAFFVLGMMDAARGILGHMAITDVLRDFSVPVYTLFLLTGLYQRRGKALIEQFCLMIVCGAVLSTLTGLSWYLVHPDIRRYILVEVYVALAFMIVTLAVVERQLSFLVGAPLLLLLACGVIVSNARSVYLGLGVCLGLQVLLGIGRVKAKDLLKTAGIAIVVVVIAMAVLLQTHAGAQYVNRVTDQLVQGFLHPSGDDNVQFRFLAWAEAGRRFLMQPVLGEGYGVPFTWELAQIDIRPHNIFLTVLYKMGILGLAAFMTLLALPLLTAWRAIRKHVDHPHAVLLRGLFLSQVFFFCYGVLNPVIENPFLASICWLNFGFMLYVARQTERDARQCALPAETNRQRK